MIQRYLLATDFCLRILRDRPGALRQKFNDEADGLCLSDITFHELLTSAAHSSQPAIYRKEVERFAARVNVLPFDSSAATHSAEISAGLNGSDDIAPYDLLVAGLARSQGLVMVTDNPDGYAAVPGLRCEMWR
jgi:tRNA(fMet)-specific endonuclease VapC